MIPLKPYDAIVGVSPMKECGEKKDQDRAVWSPQGQTAGLADGVSSSPDSQDAATLVTEFCPAIYSGNPENSLRPVCDLLLKKREEKMATEINVASHLPEHMKELLIEVSRQKLAESYQTTFVSAKLEPNDKTVKMKTFRCGDSPLFVFSSDGKLITSSPSMTTSNQDNRHKDMVFRPGDEMLARVECDLAEYKDALNVDISKEYHRNWLVCVPVDQCKNNDNDLVHCP